MANLAAPTALHSGNAVASSKSYLRLCVALFIFFGVSYALFNQDSYSHNVICRAGLVANFAQHARLDINDYEKLTADKAIVNGNYYCDKAPGMSFLALPAALAFTQIFPISGDTPSANGRVWSAFVYLCTLSTSVLLCAAAAVMLFHYLVRRTGDVQAGLVGSLTFGLGTPIWGWATSFFSHATTGALLIMGFIALDAAVRRLAAHEQSLIPALLSGWALGAATAVEYTSLVPAAIIGASIAAVSPWRGNVLSIILMFAVAGLGALAALAPVLVYHDAAFGSPFATGYQNAAFFGATRTGFFGIGAPNFTLLEELVFGQRRGLLWISPVMLASAWAIGVAARHRDTRAPAIAAALIMVWYLLMNSGFSYWAGGWSTGPRYLTPALGFMAIPLGLAWAHFGFLERRATLFLLGASIIINLACTAVDMTAPEDIASPLTQHILPNLLDGQINQTLTFKVTNQPGLLHLAPLLGVWAAFAWIIRRETQRVAHPHSGHAEREIR